MINGIFISISNDIPVSGYVLTSNISLIYIQILFTQCNALVHVRINLFEIDFHAKMPTGNHNGVRTTDNDFGGISLSMNKVRDSLSTI